MTADPEIPLLSTVPERLNLLAELYKQRQKLYGNNYKLIGDAFVALFPEGLTLKTSEDFNRFSLFVQILTKMTRYGQMFAKGGHTDSLNDMAVYAQMLQELDDVNLCKEPNKNFTFDDFINLTKNDKPIFDFINWDELKKKFKEREG